MTIVNKLQFPSPKVALWQVWPSGSVEDFKILSIYFCYFIIISPWKRARSFIWTKFNPIYPRMHCANFGWNWPSGSWEDFKILSMYYSYFVIISPWKRAGPFIWKRAGPFIWTNLNPIYPRKLCAKFGWNWPICSGQEDFSCVLYFRDFVIIST